MNECDICHKTLETPAGLKTHRTRMHKAEALIEAVLDPDPAEDTDLDDGPEPNWDDLEPETAGPPAVTAAATKPTYGGKRKFGARNGIREIKLASPHCDICQTAESATDWWKSCTHDPYFTATAKDGGAFKFVPEIGEDGQPTGDLLKVVDKDATKFTRQPWLTQRAVTQRHATGLGMAFIRQRWANTGLVPPESLPGENIKPFCEFRDCWSQDIQFKVKAGSFCCEEHAKYVTADAKRKYLEVFDTEVRNEQLDSIAL